MNFVKFLLTFTLLAMASVKVNCLECYVCTEDCDDHLNLRSQVCGASATTTPSSTTTTTEATTTTTPTTTRQTTMGFSTSSIPPTSTGTTTTTAGTSTTTTDVTTTSTTTTQPTTLYTGTPTTTAVTTTTTTYIPPTEGPTDSPTVITDPPTTEATTAPPTDAPLPAVRNRRSLSQKELAVNHLLQNYRSKSRQRRDTDASAWVCYAINKEDGESKTRVYGCVSIPQDETACQAIRNEVGLSSDADEDKYQCSYCFTDNCNGSATLKLSIVALAGVLLLKWLL